MTNMSISIDEDTITWLDYLIEKGIIQSRSEAVKGGIYQFIREKLSISSRKELRSIMKKRLKQPMTSGSKIIKQIREEEDNVLP